MKKIEELENIGNKLKKPKLKQFMVFKSTIENKFIFSRYCLDRINEIKREGSMSDPVRIDFYIDSFFIHAFSIFDILAQIINLILLIERKHRKVSFDFLVKKLT